MPFPRIAKLSKLLFVVAAHSVVVAGNSGDAVEVGRHPCDRECAEGEEPRECRFEFDVELYNTLGKVRTMNDKNANHVDNASKYFPGLLRMPPQLL